MKKKTKSSASTYFGNTLSLNIFIYIYCDKVYVVWGWTPFEEPAGDALAPAAVTNGAAVCRGTKHSVVEV